MHIIDWRDISSNRGDVLDCVLRDELEDSVEEGTWKQAFRGCESKSLDSICKMTEDREKERGGN